MHELKMLLLGAQLLPIWGNNSDGRSSWFADETNHNVDYKILDATFEATSKLVCIRQIAAILRE